MDGIFQSAVKHDGALIETFVRGDSAEAKINGAVEISDKLRTKYRLMPDRLKCTRNYYIYLYGLPMKLNDPGTHLDPTVAETRFEGQEVYSLKVTYDEAVGKDVWYFYFDHPNYALIGYRFYHDESKNDGEYIILQDEAVTGGMRLPKIRRWHANSDNKYLGTDTITSFEQIAK